MTIGFTLKANERADIKLNGVEQYSNSIRLIKKGESYRTTVTTLIAGYIIWTSHLNSSKL